jgi:hypothetical protein
LRGKSICDPWLSSELILESDDTRSEPVIEMGKTAGVAKNRETTWWSDFVDAHAGRTGFRARVPRARPGMTLTR